MTTAVTLLGLDQCPFFLIDGEKSTEPLVPRLVGEGPR